MSQEKARVRWRRLRMLRFRHPASVAAVGRYSRAEAGVEDGHGNGLDPFVGPGAGRCG